MTFVQLVTSKIWPPVTTMANSCRRSMWVAGALAENRGWLFGTASAASAAAGASSATGAAVPLKSIRDSVSAKKKILQMSKKEKRMVQGNLGKYANNCGRPEFHNVDLDRHGRIFEPTDVFEICITSSKNNVWIAVINKSRSNRTVFTSHAGNVGIRKCGRRTIDASHRIASNVARKCRRLGVSVAEVRFRWLMKVEAVLQAFQAHGLQITRITHVPRLPKGDPPRARKRRRV
eukprot:g3188.t1